MAANVTILIVYAVCCGAAVALRRRGVRGSGVPFDVPFTRVAPWLALAVIAWMLSGLERGEWGAAAIITAVAAAVFVVTIPTRRSRLASS